MPPGNANTSYRVPCVPGGLVLTVPSKIAYICPARAGRKPDRNWAAPNGRNVWETAMMYHVNGEQCVDAWNCGQAEHRSWASCAAPETRAVSGQPATCYLPKGHPGPHCYFHAGWECQAA